MDIILDKNDLRQEYLNTNFNDIRFFMFFNLERSYLERANLVVYREYTGNPDIPYIEKKIKDRGVRLTSNQPRFSSQITLSNNAGIEPTFDNFYRSIINND